MAFFDPWSSAHRADPHAFWRRWRERGPVAVAPGPQTGRSFHFLMGHAEATTALRSPVFGKEPEKHLPDSAMTVDLTPPGPFAVLERNMLFADPPDHTRLRRLARDGFSNRSIAKLEPRVREIATQLAASMARNPESDLITEFALPLPVTVIAEMLGIPAADHDRFRSWTHAVLGRVDSEDEMMLAGMEFVAYLNDLAAMRRQEPTEDLTSHLLHYTEDGDSLSHEEFLAMVFLLLVAGHETTVNLIGNGMIELMERPDQYAVLQQEPDVIPSAVEEMLRFHGPVETSTMRWAYEPMDVGDTTIEQGDLVIAVLMAANRDPAVFEDPDTFDVRRNPRGHLAFGSGIHLCLGAPLARLEAQLALEMLMRGPRLELAIERSDLEWTQDFFLRGATSVPVQTPG